MKFQVPWVSRELFDCAIQSRDVEHDVAMVLRREMIERETAHRLAVEQKDAAYRDLLEKYHALREKGYTPIDAASFPIVTSPIEQLGSATKAALAAASRGLPHANRRAMEAKALELYAQKWSDTAIAAAVQRGESVMRVAT